MRDMLGQEYGIGDWVAYATTSARSPVLKIGIVEKTETREGRGEMIHHWIENPDKGPGQPAQLPPAYKTIQYEVPGIRAKLAGGPVWAGASGVQLSWPNHRNIVKVNPPKE